eukprot:TRINITY_DN382_c0_g1_i1.p1 TRINITY_DN382_c0_g1~~TRINITY_DN382_c0_g1_i1.p1  ORF type:complete len:423 (-),score=91.52 TRINITY_DN382_c0_g1_i1:92-1255(-)
MEAKLKEVLQNTFGEYVRGLDKVDVQFPLVLNNLQLKEKEIQDAIDENGNFPFDITDGRIGQITVKPGWMGSIEVCATNVVLNMSFSAVKAMKRAMRPEEPEEEEEAVGHGYPGYPPPQMMAPAAPIAPRFCCNHDASEKRVKGEPMERECRGCKVRLQTSYADFAYCPACSERLRSCMICGDHAPDKGNYVPHAQLPPQLAGAAASQQGMQRGFNDNGPISRELPPPPPPPLQGNTGRAAANFEGHPPAPPAPPSRQSHREQYPMRAPTSPDRGMGGAPGGWGPQGFPPSPQQQQGAPWGGAGGAAGPCGGWSPAMNGPPGGAGYPGERAVQTPAAAGGVFGFTSLNDVHQGLLRMLDFNSWANCNTGMGTPGHINNLSGGNAYAY